MFKSEPPVPQNLTVLEAKAFKEVIKLKWVRVDPNPSCHYIVLIFIYWRERKREEGIEGNIGLLFHSFMHSLVSSSMRPERGSKPRPSPMGTALWPTELPGQSWLVLLEEEEIWIHKESRPASTLTLDFSLQDCGKISSYCLSHPACGVVMAAQAKHRERPIRKTEKKKKKKKRRKAQ